MALLFLDAKYKQLFSQLQLDDFEQLWSKKIDWFEEPNRDRGGWSGVGQLMLKSSQDDLNVFIKKQKNYGRRTLLHPVAGEPTFRREFSRLQYLQKHHISAARVVYYGEKHNGNDKAILITETLLDYQPLDQVITQYFVEGRLPIKQRRMLIKQVALLLRRFHQSGLEHRALFPKHIFVKDAAKQPKIALIDLEKARFNLFFYRRAYYDLAKLNRHTAHLSKTERMYFLLTYFQRTKLNWFLKRFCQKLLQRSSRK